jgi:hypothetical protein
VSSPLDADLAKLKSLIGEAGDAGVDAAAIKDAKSSLAKAEEAQTRRAKAIETLNAAASPSPLAVDVPTLRKAVAAAEEAGAPGDVVKKGRVALEAALEVQAKRDDSTKALESAIKGAKEKPKSANLDTLQSLMMVADAAGAPAELIKRARATVAELQKVQEAQKAVRAAALKKMEAASAFAPETLDVANLRAAINEAEEAGVAADKLARCRSRMEEAAAVQRKAKESKEKREAERRANLCIDLKANPDLQWIVTRARACVLPAQWRVLDDKSKKGAAGSYYNKVTKQTSLAKPTDAYFIELGAASCDPPWPPSLQLAASYMRNGWFCARAMAEFNPEHDREIHFGANEQMYVNGDDLAPEGWVIAAREAAPRRSGLVPRSYMAALDFGIVAPKGYTSSSPGELSFVAGDELVIRPAVLPAEGWWLGRRCRDGRRGYVPRYVCDESWRDRGARAVALIWHHYRGSRKFKDVFKAHEQKKAERKKQSLQTFCDDHGAMLEKKLQKMTQLSEEDGVLADVEGASAAHKKQQVQLEEAVADTPREREFQAQWAARQQKWLKLNLTQLHQQLDKVEYAVAKTEKALTGRGDKKTHKESLRHQKQEQEWLEARIIEVQCSSEL